MSADDSAPQTPWHQVTAQRKAQKQEKRLGKLPGSKRQPASGRIPGFRRDVRLNGFLVEARVTEKDSYTISAEEFQRIERDALQTPPGMLPGMQIDFDAWNIHLFVMRLDDHLFFQQRAVAHSD